MPSELHELLESADVEDIVLKPAGLCFFRSGRWTGPSPSTECAPEKLERFARHLAEKSGLTLGLTQPSADAYLRVRDDLVFRAHVAVMPLVLEGPEITLRRLSKLATLDLDAFEMTPTQRSALRAGLQRGESLLIAGGTGSGKSSLLSALLRELPATTRILILEDSPELPLPNPLSSKLLARNNRFGFREGAEWDLSHLVFESLRMRPDRIVVGECRGAEAVALAQALRTGHGGLLATIHAGSASEALERFADLLRQHAPAERPAIAELERLWGLRLHLRQRADGVREVDDFLVAGRPIA